MQRLLICLITVLFTIASCSKGSDSTPTPTSEYNLQITLDGKTYTYKPGYLHNYNNIPNVPAGYADISGYNTTGTPLDFSIKIEKALIGKPETIKLTGGYFVLSQFENYQTNPALSPPGTVVFDKVDNTMVEGTFTVNFYDRNSKLFPSTGRFKIKL